MKKLALIVALLIAFPLNADTVVRGGLSRAVADSLYVALAGGSSVAGTTTFTNLTVSGTCTGCGGGAAAWGAITGTLSAQTDLQSALDLKAPLNSPSFTTPSLGVATATTINKVTITTPAAGSTLTIINGKTLTVPLDASVSGTNTGDQTSVNGNAGSATVLQTARAINGVSFDGSAPITVTAAAGTLSGATLAAGVTASSLTSLGTSPAFTTPSVNTSLTFSANSSIISNNVLAVRETAANTRTVLRAIPNGTVSNSPTTFESYGTDLSADAVNYERFVINSKGSGDTNYVIGTEIGGTGTVRPLMLRAGSSNSNLLLNIDGSVTLGGAINKLTLTAPATAATVTIANNKTFTVSNTITLAGTDSTTMTFPSTSATIARTDAAQTFIGVQTFPIGSAGAPSIVGVGGTVTGLYWPTTLQLGITTNGVSRLLIDNNETRSSVNLATAANVMLTATGVVGFPSGSATQGAIDASLGRAAVGTLGVGGVTRTGFYVQGGDCFVAADTTNATTTMATSTCLVGGSAAITVTSGRKYSFTCEFFLSDSTSVDGAQIDFNGGTATATNFRAQITAFDTALNLSSQITALATAASASTFTGNGAFEVHGSFEPSSNGTFLPRFAQVAHTTGTLTLARGSNCRVHEM